MAQSGPIVRFYKSRKTIISYLNTQGFVVDNYDNFSINEVNSMFQTKQLDMLFENKDKTKKSYVKFHLGNTMRPVDLYEYIEDLFNLEETLKKGDDLNIIIKDEPNETILKTIKNIWEQDGIFIMIYSMNHLQFNVLEHSLQPKFILLNEAEATAVKKEFNITNDSELPDITRFSPVAQPIGMRPGNICKIIRPSKTAISSTYYRICSQ
jgi:DNA-directed RNA polymerase subunit H (RpoH/RPB5)